MGDDRKPKAVPVNPPDATGGDEKPPKAKAAPKDPDAPSRGRGRPAGSGTNIGKLEKQLEELIGATGLIFMARGDFYCAEVIGGGASELAKAWCEVAKTNTGVRKVLETLVAGSAWGAVLTSTAAIAVPIAEHHGMWPEKWPNPFFNPELAAKYKTGPFAESEAGTSGHNGAS